MKKLFKHTALYIILIWLVIFISKFELLIDITSLIVKSISYLFSDSNFILSQFDLKFADFVFCWLIFIAAVPLTIFLIRKNITIDKIGKRNFIFAVLFILVLTAPILTSFDPDFYRDINQTKLLSPLSTEKYFVNETGTIFYQNKKDAFVALKNKVFNKSNGTNIIYCDSVSIKDKLILYQGTDLITIPLNKKVLETSYPYLKYRTFLFGTDEFGRDIFTRMMYGMRLSLFIAGGSVLLCLLLGIILGYFAGYYGGWLDVLLSRFTDVFLTFPAIFLVVLAIALFGSSILSVIIVLGFSGWMSLFKIVKGEVISIKNRDYFITARKIGLNDWQLLFKEIFPVISVKEVAFSISAIKQGYNLILNLELLVY